MNKFVVPEIITEAIAKSNQFWAWLSQVIKKYNEEKRQEIKVDSSYETYVKDLIKMLGRGKNR